MTLIPNIQKDVLESEVDLWKTITNLISYMDYPIVFGSFLLSGQRWRAFYYVMAFAGSSFVIDTLKLNYHCGRPYWASSDVEAFSCSGGFGSPSGHAMICMGRPFLVWLDYQASN